MEKIDELPSPSESLQRSRFRRARSLHGPSPTTTFGPKACIQKNPASIMHVQDPLSQRLTWNKPPLSVLIIKKIHESSVVQPFMDLVTWLVQEKRMVVYVEVSTLEDEMIADDSGFQPIKQKLNTFKEGTEDLSGRIDFIICLGGDGTLLWASSLFQGSVPPVMAFHMGSLGFLTPFEFDNFKSQVNHVLEGHAALTLRSRLKTVITDAECDSHINSIEKPKKIQVLNEVVIDRGPSPYLCHLDLYVEGRHVTSVQGDGLIVSTPTGSTAYAVAAGASMVHPNVPAILVTPICPHSLSFRPIVVPAGVEIKVMVSPESRGAAWVSLDGRNRQEIKVGDSVRITTSEFPIPSICKMDQISDWFDSLAECLHWNVRRPQRAFNNNNGANGRVKDDSDCSIEA
ncbi:PREDICTED: NAD kinase-like isoform X2 [Branchiostoma belcheri]|uniref:NAD(+) kinase n=1 Tax=Branchiostoma belcheri TaxID=7741 RepID=A0A6P4ZUK0_BRABE|nr:PREDICTED: NAD kinase-like isoform X2 [Branchiostoma belcheri]KAI8517178.1 hypothetical protein Bbelb_057590 [Branchiostoma belcheri]